MVYSTDSSGTSSNASDDEWEVAELVVCEAIALHASKLIKRPYRTDALSGRQYVINVLEGHEDRSLDVFRMKAHVLYDLSDQLRDRKLLTDTRHVTVEEQVGIFLYTVGKNASNRTTAVRFQHSGDTISRHFRNVLKAICKFSKEVITPPDMNITHSHIKSKGDKNNPWFKDCIGVLDGTHISAAVPTGTKQIPYRGRKNIPTQNVMCACDFDMCFTSILAGWEGSANDSRILNEAIGNPQLKFPLPPKGKYYVVDSGYANQLGFLTPYKGERYHLNDYKGRDKFPKTAKERFNFAHSSLRNIIERCFGVLKARFPILKLMPNYSLRKQRNIVIATCAIHNFIRKHALEDSMFKDYEDDDLVLDSVKKNSEANEASTSGARSMDVLRERICKSMSTYYHLPM